MDVHQAIVVIEPESSRYRQKPRDDDSVCLARLRDECLVFSARQHPTTTFTFVRLANCRKTRWRAAAAQPNAWRSSPTSDCDFFTEPSGMKNQEHLRACFSTVHVAYRCSEVQMRPKPHKSKLSNSFDGTTF